MTEEAIETVADISNEIVPIRYGRIVIPCAVLVGAAICAYFLYRKHVNQKEESGDDGEIAYTYEDAVAKAKAKRESVKLSQDQDKPDLKSYSTKSSIEDSGIDKESQLKYTKTVEDLGYSSREKIVEEDEKDEDDSFKPYTDEMTGMWFRVAEDKYKYANPFYDKREFVYFSNDRVLEEISTSEKVDDSELIRRLATLCRNEEHSDVYFFTNEEEGLDYKIHIEDDWNTKPDEA